jgi:hypothetical protein
MNSICSKVKTWAPLITYSVMLALLYAISASQAMWSFAYKWTTIADHPEYSLEKVLDGSSPKPYASRILVPRAINLVSNLMPESVSGMLIERSRLMLEAILGGRLAGMMNDKLALAYASSLLSDFLFIFLTLILLRSISTQYFEKTPVSKVVLDLSPIAFALLLTISYRTHNGFIYDQFEIFIFVLYLFLTKRRTYHLSMIVLALAIMNKETAIFFPVFGVAIRWCEERRSMAKELGWLAMEFSVVATGFLAVKFLLMDLPGSSTEWHFFTNLKFWFSWHPWLAITTPHFPLLPLPKPTNILVLGTFLVMIFGYWRYKPLAIRVLLTLSGLINLPLCVFFCYRDEYRNLSLMFPFLYLSAVHTSLYFFGNVGTREN